MNVPTPATRSRLAAVAATVLAAAGLAMLTSTAEGQATPAPATAQTRVHWSNGQALAAPSRQGRGAGVRGYLAGHGVGRAAADTLRPTGPAWSVRGVSYLRMQQYVAGLRVADGYAKAAFDAQGRLISLIENTSPAGAPRPATVSRNDALRAAIASLYPQGGARFPTAPTVEKVAVPMSDRRLSEGFLVTTWDQRNQLNETLVAGNGAVIRSDLRTANDSYNIFPESPGVSGQTLVSNPADATASPSGWLSGAQWSNHISGNNAHAYLDDDNNNAPDANDESVADGVFGAVFDPATEPGTGDNPDVAVQNLFYLNNLIHDRLYAAGFTEGAGNFQQDNFANGGLDGDPVQAEAQDGGGIDNANFSSPPDGTPPRMQMYLWTPIGAFEVAQNGSTYAAQAASFGTPLDATGVTGPTVVGSDAKAPAGDACERLAPVAAGSVVIVDRGKCTYVQKATNVQQAGAAAMVVVNNVAGQAEPMGGAKAGRVTISALMVSMDDGPALKAAAPAPATLRSVTSPPFRDVALDSDVVWHEYGHGLTWRMIGSLGTIMSAAIGEGMSDVLAVIAADDPVVAEYGDTDPNGLRSESYEGYSRTYGDIVGQQIHFDGEVYGAIGWDLWKQYRDSGLGADGILADLVGGMNFTPANPNFQQMRDGILMGLTASGHEDRACMVWSSFARYGVGVGATSIVRGPKITVTESFTKPAECT